MNYFERNNVRINQSDVSIDHLINDRLFEPQRLAHSYIEISFPDNFLDIYGESLSAITDNKYYTQNLNENVRVVAEESHFKYTPNNVLRVALSSNGMPNHSGEVIAIRKGNEIIKFNGVETYDNISMSFTDWIGADVERVLTSWDGRRYNPRSGISAPAYMYKFPGTLVQYSPDGLITRTWELMGTWLNDLRLGEYSRESNGVREMSCTLVIDKAIPSRRQ